ncbi:hypothetical protein [Bacteroides caecimuris]|uniref:hypothetical protein n=1 Tax=Bacteroides caecimuris TaxID=1796613 RepID=UPI002572CA61|nr:hypothetical protein [Bacteroides caecimuris]
MEQKIFEIEDLKELEEFLQSQSEIEQLRECLFAEFLKYADYKMPENGIKPFAFVRAWLLSVGEITKLLKH